MAHTGKPAWIARGRRCAVRAATDRTRALADDFDARAIIDLGCGTGLLTVTLAKPGRSVTGIDPSANMLGIATTRPGGEAVRWIHGDSSSIERDSADLVVRPTAQA
ncbi:MAG: methyltransferase [Frondihabitans sp.]|nr:methyltransferase [Frondihabitans sp.]